MIPSRSFDPHIFQDLYCLEWTPTAILHGILAWYLTWGFLAQKNGPFVILDQITAKTQLTSTKKNLALGYQEHLILVMLFFLFKRFTRDGQDAYDVYNDVSNILALPKVDFVMFRNSNDYVD